MNSIHQFKVEGINGGLIDFSEFSGKKILVVNVASACGYTPQYGPLQELHEQYGSQVAVIGFPCNDFGGQEPGSPEEIQQFCERNFGVTFLLSAKIKITGEPHPIYAWLQQKSQNGVMDSEVKWNFHKFLLNEAGELQQAYPSSVSPIDERILEWAAQ